MKKSVLLLIAIFGEAVFIFSILAGKSLQKIEAGLLDGTYWKKGHDVDLDEMDPEEAITMGFQDFLAYFLFIPALIVMHLKHRFTPAMTLVTIITSMFMIVFLLVNVVFFMCWNPSNRRS